MLMTSTLENRTKKALLFLLFQCIQTCAGSFFPGFCCPSPLICWFLALLSSGLHFLLRRNCAFILVVLLLSHSSGHRRRRVSRPQRPSKQTTRTLFFPSSSSSPSSLRLRLPHTGVHDRQRADVIVHKRNKSFGHHRHRHINTSTKKKKRTLELDIQRQRNQTDRCTTKKKAKSESKKGKERCRPCLNLQQLLQHLPTTTITAMNTTTTTINNIDINKMKEKVGKDQEESCTARRSRGGFHRRSTATC